MATNEIRAEIERLIEQKRDEIKALETTLRMISSENTATYSQSATKGVVLSDQIDVSDRVTSEWNSLGVITPEHGPTLAERVKSVLEMIPEDQEFTVPHIEALLKKTGFTLPGKSPRARIAMIMNQIEDQGLVIRTAKPKGFKPHRFRIAKNDDKNMSLVK